MDLAKIPAYEPVTKEYIDDIKSTGYLLIVILSLHRITLNVEKKKSSHIPIFGEYIPMFDRYDSFIMHVIVPVLTVTSFVVNDSTIGKLRPMQRWHGTWFITIYAIVILTLVTTGALEHSLIPYFFLDVVHNPFWLSIVAFIVIYGIAYLMAWFLSEVNRKLSWKWYKGFSK